MNSNRIKTSVHALWLLAFAGLFSQTLCAQQVRTITRMDQDWKFTLGDPADAQSPELDDRAWRTLNVPHDWSIEGEPEEKAPSGSGGGFMPTGIGWYRKHLVIPQNASGKRIFIEFEGIMANSDVWINGHHLGKRPYGYSTFEYELTGKVTFGPSKPNVLAVRVDNSVQPASRWYAGCGIYRHVHLITVNPVHLEQWGVFLTSADISPQKANVTVQASVVNQSQQAETVSVQTVLTAPDGKTFTSAAITLSVAAGDTALCTQLIPVSSPQLWDLESPHLYQARTVVKAGSREADDAVNAFGIRDARFEPATGFYLNGKNLKIFGVCLHHDGGAVGAAVPAEVWKRRLTGVKAIGANAIRTAHNPMDPTFYRLCDELGLLVMDESFDTWMAPKPRAERAYNLHFQDWWAEDTRAMVMRDRNHPSVIMYSVGNEIRDPLNQPEGRDRFLMQRDLIKKLDPTRPITMALFRPNGMQVYDNGFAELMDVVGQNYRESELVAAWKAKPERKVIGTENGHEVNTWLVLRDNPFMAGQFLWTGVCYLGEAQWPAIGSGSALLDRTGLQLPAGFQRQSWWNPKPMVSMVRSGGGPGGRGAADWTPADFGTYDVANISVYSNCEEVELFLNGVSHGRQAIHANATPRQWTLDFVPGVLRAVGYNRGEQVAVEEYRSAENPVKVKLVAEKSTLANTWDDVVFVSATLVDKNGERNPNMDQKVTFRVSGPGTILAVDNGSATSHEKYKASERTTYLGRAVAIIQATADSGTITVSASVEGLEGSSVSIQALPVR